MKRNVLLLLLAVAGGTAAMIACSSSDNSTFPGDTFDAGGGDGGPGFFPDAAADGEGGSPQCQPSIPATFAPTWAPPTTAADACSPTDITDYYNACLGPAGGDGPCAAYKTAHTTCFACIETDANTGPIQWLDPAGQPHRHFAANIAGCIAIEQQDSGADSCGAAYAAAVECQRESCSECQQSGGTDDEFAACEQSVSGSGVCKSYQDSQASTCVDLNEAGAATNACFKSSTTETSDVYFPRLIGVFCGPADDGGT